MLKYKQINSQNYKNRVVTAKQMTKVDEIAINEFGITLLQMMEVAGKQLANLCTENVGKNQKVLVLAGSGHNGGGGLVAAKYLHNWGYNVSVFLTSINLKEATKHQLDKLESLSVQIHKSQPNFSEFGILVDSILGYSVKGEVKEPIKSIINEVNTSDITTISLDLPSGLNPNSGKPKGVAVKAFATLTLAAPKTGLLKPDAKLYTGDLYLADIGIPEEVFKLI